MKAAVSLLALPLAVCWIPCVSAADWVSPVAVPLSSGPAFPQGRDNRNPPDPQYAAERAIDGHRETFCCLLDDSRTGPGDQTIPPRAAAPVTGYMVFDLGRPWVVYGLKLISRDCAGAFNPKNVTCFYFADDRITADALTQQSRTDSPLRLLCSGRDLPPLQSGAATTIIWEGVVARYIGLRVHDSYESGGGGTHYNFQIAEIEFCTAPNAAQLAPGSRLPPLYQKQATLAETLLATRQRLEAVGVFSGDGQAEVATVFAEQVWQQVRRDFPAATHQLLQYFSSDWLGATGWLAGGANTQLEQRLIRRAAEETRSADSAQLQTELDTLLRSQAAPCDPRWLQLCERAAELATLLTRADKLRRAVVDLADSLGERYQGRAHLRQLREFQDRALAASRAAPPGASFQTLAVELERLQHAALVTGNPLLSPGRLLFVKRFTYNPGWYYADFMRASRFGGGLNILSLPDGQVSEVKTGLQGGLVDRFDLAFDARRIVFGYKSALGVGFRLYEVGVDGQGLRQLTEPPADEPQRIEKYWHPQYKPDGVFRHHTDDFHPCYLPDGGICFASTRCERGVLCDQSDSLAVNTLYRIEADGSRLQMLSRNALSESTPSLMEDGRVLYTRWEYVDKGVIAVQSLWAMRPDGSGSREIYGNDIEFPPVFLQARAIPGSSQLFVCTATMHHPFSVGPILLVRSDRDVRTLEPIQSLTPDTDLSVEGKDGRPHAEDFIHRRNGQWVKDNVGPLFADPYPLYDPQTGAGAGKYFLVACNPDRHWSDVAAYGLYLIDVFGNRVCLYRDPAISCWQPMPLRPRSRPPIVAAVAAHPQPAPPAPSVASNAAADSLRSAAEPAAAATVVLHDVYAGLEGIPRGKIKYLRILEQVPRPWSARRFWPDDSAYGQHAVISLSSHIHVKIHHGVVPVEADGSAHFLVPADKNLFFQALDEDFMEIQRMRTFINLRPGECRSCVGCHEYRPQAPSGRVPLALRSPPQRPGPQPGETVPRPIHYVTDVQPLWDAHCVRCHGPQRTDGGLDLSGELTTFFNRSYENLIQRKQVAYIQEFYGPQPDAQVTNAAPIPPLTVGSPASPLVQILRRSHYDVRLTQADFVRLVTWVDANAPYYGSYFGRRNLKYKAHQDFRPLPTVETASGLIRE